jgi:hypothetical protein
MSRTPSIHFVQYDLFVSMTPKEAEAFMLNGLEGKGFDFEDGSYKLINQPAHVRKDRSSGEYHTWKNNLYSMPCDWHKADWEFFLEHLRDSYGEYLA